MKKLVRTAILISFCIVSSFLLITGCKGPDGPDGKAFLEVTTDVDGIIYDDFGLGTSWDFGTQYEVSPGTESGAYVAYYWSYYGADTHYSGTHYHVFFGCTGWYYSGSYYWSTSSVSNCVSLFYSNYYSSLKNHFTYAITVNPGEPGGLFNKAGAAGADSYFTLALDFYDVSLSSANVPASEVKVFASPDGHVVKELTDGSYTFRLEYEKPSTAVPEGGPKAIKVD